MAADSFRPFPGFHNERTHYWVWGLVLLVMLFAGAIRVRLLEFPLERDEGEYAYTGRLMLQGIAPYREAYFMKLPGTHAAYALIMAVFGQTGAGIHLGLLVVNAMSTLLVFLLGRKLSGSAAGLIACAAYALMSLSSCVYGMSAHATQFVVLFALAGMFALCRAIETKRGVIYFLSGLFFGLAILMKQPGALFLAFGALLIAWSEFRGESFDWKRCGRREAWLIGGAVLPYAVTCLALWRAGVFGRFWFWTVTCVRAYGREVPLSWGLNNLGDYFELHGDISMLLWALAVAGAVCLAADSQAGVARPFVTVFLLISAVALCQGLYFRPHYFILVLPALALAVGAGAGSARRMIREAGRPAVWSAGPAVLFVASLGLVVAGEKDFLFKATPDEVCRSTYYPGNPFIEARAIADYIRDHTAAGERIAVLGSEPEIFFYSGRRSATGYLYTYNLMETGPYVKQMQEDMNKEIELARPELLVVVKMLYSWARTAKSDPEILNWLKRYNEDHYEMVGAVNYPSGQPAKFYWGKDAVGSAQQMEEAIYLFKKKVVPPPANTGAP